LILCCKEIKSAQSDDTQCGDPNWGQATKDARKDTPEKNDKDVKMEADWFHGRIY
jgi:hypothetical protein